MGTLTRNTQRQLAVTRRPPITGPRAAASPPMAVQVRTAPPRRSGGDEASTRPRGGGGSRAAPAAWTRRNAPPMAPLLAAPQAPDAAGEIAPPRGNPAL